MKHILIFAMVILIVVSGCTVFGRARTSEYSLPGEILEGSAMGFRGLIHVQVRLDGDSITEILVVDSVEDRFVGGAAIEDLIDRVIEYNSTDVDVISGATITSKGFLEAVNQAIMRL